MGVITIICLEKPCEWMIEPREFTEVYSGEKAEGPQDRALGTSVVRTKFRQRFSKLAGKCGR